MIVDNDIPKKWACYIIDPIDKKWYVALYEKRQIVGNGDWEDISNNIKETPPFSLRLPSVNIDEGDLEEFFAWDDHGEEICVEDLSREKKN